MTSAVDHLPALQAVVPMLAAPLVVLLRVGGLAWAATTATSVLCFFIAVTLTGAVLGGGPVTYAMGGWPAPYGIALEVDALSALLLLVLTGASSLALIGGRASLDADIEPSRQSLFYAAWLLVLAGLAGILVAADAFNIFVFMEISSLASYVIIAGGPDRRVLPAVFKYLMMGTIGATFYLIGIGLIYMMTGTLNLADMALRVAGVADLRPVLVASSFIAIGLALKAAVFPLHVWLPNTYTWAPHMVTAFLAACATKIALYVLLRLDFVVFLPNLAGHDVQFATLMMPLALLAILIASAVAIREAHLKRLLAWSSLAQIGYILLGASFVSGAGLQAAVLHMYNHALAKGALFLAVAGFGMRLATLEVEALRGIGRRMPWTMAGFAVAALSLVGVPGTAGFISKWYLILAALDEGTLGIGVVAVILVSSLMAAVYLWRVLEVAYFPGGDAEQAMAPAVAEAPPMLLGATLLAAALNVWFGFDPSLPLRLSALAAAALGLPLP